MQATRLRVTPEDGTDTIPGVRSNVFAQSVVLTRIMDYWGRTGGLSLVLPYALIDTSAGPFRASTNGVSDVGFLWQMNIFGGPALTREQFQSFVPQTFSSFHLLVTTPLGTYNPTSPINPSANRWMVSPTVNFSYTPDQGWTWVETYVSVRVFTDNNNYLVNGAQTLSQKPVLRLEEHLSRNVTDALWLSLDAFYNVGGETSIDGVGQNNMANTLRSRGGHGPAPVARRRPWPQLRARGRQTRGRTQFADRALHLQAIVVKHADRRHVRIQLQGGVGRRAAWGRTDAFAFVLGRRLPAQSTAEDRFFTLPARSQGRFLTAAEGRLWPSTDRLAGAKRKGRAPTAPSTDGKTARSRRGRSKRRPSAPSL